MERNPNRLDIHFGKCSSLLRAEKNKEDPEDYVVAGNLAYAYECAGDYTNARIWYEKLTKIDNEDAQEYGKQGLEIIKGK